MSYIKNHIEPVSFPFLAAQIGDAIYGKYCKGKSHLGMLHLEFIRRLNRIMVCLTCSIPCHQLRAYRLAVYHVPRHFKSEGVGGRRG